MFTRNCSRPGKRLLAFLGTLHRRSLLCAHTLRLVLLEERDECWKNNSKARYTELDRMIRKAAAIAKCEYVETQIADHDWKGVKMCKPYRQTPHRVFDKDGNSRVLHLQRIMRLRSGTPPSFRLCLIALHSFLQRTCHVGDLVHTSYGRSEHD